MTPEDQVMTDYNPSHYMGMMQGGNVRERMSQLIELTNENETIEEIRFILTGKKIYFDPATQKKVEVVVEKPLLTDEGSQKIIKYFKAYLNKNITLSWFDDKEIKLRCSQFHTHMTFELSRNWIAYGINSRTEHNQIVSMLGNHLRAAFNRSFKGLTLIKSLENTNVQELRNFQDNEQKLSLNPFRRRSA